MSRLLPLVGLAALLLSGCWWNTGLESIDTGWYERPEDGEPNTYPDDGPRSEYFDPNWWTLETWGYYDGERLTDFQYHSSSSGAVPAFAIVRFNDPQWLDDEEECYWAGLVKIQGWTVLDEAQHAAWGFTLEQTDTTCRDFNPAVWLETTPTTVLETHYYTMGYLPPSPELAVALDHSNDGPMAWASRDDEAAFSLQLGFEREVGTFDHFLGGAAYALKTEGENVVVWSPTGRPYPLDLDDLDGGKPDKHVVVAGTLDNLAPSLFFD